MLSGLTNDSSSTRTWYPCEAFSILVYHKFTRLPSIVSSKYNNEELNNDGSVVDENSGFFHNNVHSIKLVYLSSFIAELCIIFFLAVIIRAVRTGIE